MQCYTAKIFMNGRSQAIRLPKSCRFNDADEVQICRSGDKLIVKPIYNNWQPLLDALDAFPEEGFEIERNDKDFSYEDLF